MTGARLRRPVGFDLALQLAAVAGLVLLAAYFAVGDGRLDRWDHARGRDFVNVWTAAQLVRAGRTLEVFDPETFQRAQHLLFSPRLPLHFWSYPPPTLFMTLPFGGLGYFAALLLWTALGLLAVGPALRAFLGGSTRTRPGDLPLLLIAPAVATNVALGQNGAFTAALLLGGLALADRRPWTAGALLGLLVIKPQVALLLPVVVLSGGRWRVLGGAAASAAALLLLSVAAFGTASWSAFVAHTLPMQALMMSHGRGPFLWMMPSVFAAGRLWGWPADRALLAQVPFALLGVALAWRAWRSGAEPAVKAGVLALATFTASPQVFNYDLIPAAAAALLLWRTETDRRGPRSAWSWAGRGLALGVWVLPVAEIPLQMFNVPPGPLLLALAACRLAWTGGALGGRRYLPPPATRAAKASTAGQAASNR